MPTHRFSLHPGWSIRYKIKAVHNMGHDARCHSRAREEQRTLKREGQTLPTSLVNDEKEGSAPLCMYRVCPRSSDLALLVPTTWLLLRSHTKNNSKLVWFPPVSVSTQHPVSHTAVSRGGIPDEPTRPVTVQLAPDDQNIDTLRGPSPNAAAALFDSQSSNSNPSGSSRHLQRWYKRFSFASPRGPTRVLTHHCNLEKIHSENHYE